MVARVPFTRENNEARREQEPSPMTLSHAYVVERERWKRKKEKSVVA